MPAMRATFSVPVYWEGNCGERRVTERESMKGKTSRERGRKRKRRIGKEEKSERDKDIGRKKREREREIERGDKIRILEGKF